MPNINDRIGSQNVIRVLSNASAPPTRLLNLSDINPTLKTDDGMILVWDLPSEKFIMTSVIDSSSMTIEGIAYFNNTTESSLPANGALIVSGGVGIGQNLNVAGDIVISGISTFQDNISVTGFVTVTEGIYYDFGDYDGPNGIAYFDNTGKLVSAASTENAATTNYFILTTDAVGIPTWTSVIDGGEF